jgi:simple sugar transport system substrate-binding protein
MSSVTLPSERDRCHDEVTGSFGSWIDSLLGARAFEGSRRRLVSTCASTRAPTWVTSGGPSSTTQQLPLSDRHLRLRPSIRKGNDVIRRTPKWGLAALMSVALLLLPACSSNNAVNKIQNKAGGGAGGYGYKIAVVTHGAAGDSFWSIVKAGAQQAGKDMGDSISYQSNGDPTTQSSLIDAAVNQKPDGLVVSMANPQALKAAVQRAVAAGIPVITINAGGAESTSYGALSHIGSDESVAGQTVGTELKKLSLKNVICVIQEAGNVSLEQRCAGVKATLGGTVTNVQVENANLPAAGATIKAKLESEKSIDSVVTVGAQVSAVAQSAIADSGSPAKLAAFDLTPETLNGVKDGKILFAVDQQPFLQGYLSVVMLTQYKANLNVLGGGKPVLTGPNLITKDTAAQVIKLAQGGTR